MIRRTLLIFVLFSSPWSSLRAAQPVAAQPSTAPAGTARILHTWRFNEQTGWNGWAPNTEIKEVQIHSDGVTFRATGSDPILTSPPFDPMPANNRQWLEIDLESDSPGMGELFYTNTTEGPYHGFQQAWSTRVPIPDRGPQTAIVWPFWGSLQTIIQLRFDPPSGMTGRLRAIRIMEQPGATGEPRWNFSSGRGTWSAMHAVHVEETAGGLLLHAESSDAVIYAPVAPFEASTRSFLRLDAELGQLDCITLAWNTSDRPGLIGEPIVLTGKLAHRLPLDLRIFPSWKGTITGLAIAFGVRKGDTLELKSLSVEPSDPVKSVLRVRNAWPEPLLLRHDQKAELKVVIECVAGAGSTDLAFRITPTGSDILQYPLTVKPKLPQLSTGGVTTVSEPVSLRTGPHVLEIDVDGQSWRSRLRVAPPLKEPPPRDGCNVPRPRPVQTDYELGAYYFPGWGGESGRNRWSKQADFPERDSLLGWYQEGLPEVADWHIKWAVENGLTFFLYDWYWRDDREELGEALNAGFLKARYNHLLKFAVMWANHRPFSDHTPEQLLRVTDYWIEHYLRRPNYWRYGGKPYVNFYEPMELLRCLGSTQKVKAALDQIRERITAAGLPGLHIGACTAQDRGQIEQIAACGFDSITGYTYPTAGSFLDQSPYRAFILAHEPIWRRIEAMNLLPYIPLLTMNWDARPWHGPATRRRYLRRTADFAEGLRRLKTHLDRTGQRVALFEAWNEWGEGAYFEPNREFGFGDLEAIRDVFAKPGDWPQNVWPGDVGLAGKYDIRTASRPGP